MEMIRSLSGKRKEDDPKWLKKELARVEATVTYQRKQNMDMMNINSTDVGKKVEHKQLQVEKEKLDMQEEQLREKYNELEREYERCVMMVDHPEAAEASLFALEDAYTQAKLRETRAAADFHDYTRTMRLQNELIVTSIEQLYKEGLELPEGLDKLEPYKPRYVALPKEDLESLYKKPEDISIIEPLRSERYSKKRVADQARAQASAGFARTKTGTFTDITPNKVWRENSSRNLIYRD
ncbi:hypothetical protein FVE85_6029 [Porphyridium purpureum]|uniref:Uncharacterized protein n=1 Tax=Porphyridium purpureum TaxID=35688 RepID=A0A5J4Z629_PORPP|nr:hypothetical protein FVE85_6029 [Porphyridium purpureum]|eukprot:POR8102..scf295_1